MGPLVHMNVIRAEAKHQYFTRIVKRTNNFMNILKTMALNHQNEFICNAFTYSDRIESSKKCCVDFVHIYGHLFEETMPFESIEFLHSLFINGYKYELTLEAEYFLLCRDTYEQVAFDEFLHALQLCRIEEEGPLMIAVETIKNQRPLQAVYEQQQLYIVADHLDIE